MTKIKSRKLHLNKIIDIEPVEIKENNYQDLNSNHNPIKQEINMPVFIILVIITSLISGSFGAYFVVSTLGYNTTTTDGGITKSNAILNETNSIADAVEKVYDATVVVEVYDKNNNLTSTGTGFVYKKANNKSYLMTNNHVISKGENIKVLFTDGTELKATLIGGDTYSDIAVLLVDDSKNIITAVMGESAKSKAGDTVFTVGSPEGSEYAGTVTKGILSAKERLVAVALENNQTSDYYMEVLQTDAAINPGNSGGPICNINGEVIGITNMKLVDDTVEGMGFAIPIEEALTVAEVLEKEGKITRPKLGVSISTVDNKLTLYYQSGILVPNDIDEGIVIVSVESGGSAEKAGLKKGDIIIRLAGTQTGDLAEFRYELYKHNPGEEIEITYIRDNSEKTTKLTLSK